MRYWLSNGDGQTYGPYEVEELRTYAAEGRLDGPVQLCAEGWSQWVPASSVVAVPNASFGSSAITNNKLPPVLPTSLPTSPHGVSAAQQRWTPMSLTTPILTTLCCCLVGGVVSIVYAANANAKGAAGDITGAKRDAAISQRWILVSVVLGILGVIIVASVQR
jgi:hypothetical protein